MICAVGSRTRTRLWFVGGGGEVVRASRGEVSEPQLRESRVIVGAAAEGPAKLAFGFLDRQIVDGREPTLHEARGIELPILIAIRANPLAAVVMAFIGEANRDTVALVNVIMVILLPCDRVV